MQRGSTAVAVALLALSSWALVDSARYGIGSVTAPGPGLFPLLLAGALCVVSFALLIHQGRRSGAQARADDPQPADDRRGRKTFWLVAALLFAYTLLLEPLGFWVSSFVCLSALFNVGNAWRWPTASLAAAATVAVAYVVFIVLLNVPLPRGHWI
ncbi:MAG: tripartite tricarboxylate transporter TctB family protein [Burkholderiales bacterium]|nr:tripartite tricarboxylate transporter TctB family protein [Burkholderiales bacterium]